MILNLSILQKRGFFIKYQIERKEGNDWVALGSGNDAEQKLKDSYMSVIQNFASSFIKQSK